MDAKKCEKTFANRQSDQIQKTQTKLKQELASDLVDFLTLTWNFKALKLYIKFDLFLKTLK